MVAKLEGQRSVLDCGSDAYPEMLLEIRDPPEKLFVIGNCAALEPGLAIIGARKATPYGRSCATRFARIAAEKGICIVSGGARGCDSEAHKAALEAKGTTVVVLGGGCDQLYPRENAGLFQRVIDSGGAVVSEHDWDVAPRGYMFRMRNRLIAGLSRAVLIVEAGLPSGTFSTADEALESAREVLAVPGAITSASSQGANRLIRQGATPIVDDESFEDALFSIFGMLKRPASAADVEKDDLLDDPLIAAIRAQPTSFDALYGVACTLYGAEEAAALMMEKIVEAEARGIIARQADGKWAARVP